MGRRTRRYFVSFGASLRADIWLRSYHSVAMYLLSV